MKVYLHTFGCKANQYDTELVRQALESAGGVAVDSPEAADAAVVNSCTVTHTSESKLRRLVRSFFRMRRRPTVVMGCAAALDQGDIASLPGVARIVPGSDPEAVLDALGLDTGAITGSLRRFQRGSRAWLRVQDGCDEHCTFCATTHARGENRSRPPDEVLNEARGLAENHHEIVITGIHIGSYGSDLDDDVDLGILLQRLVECIPDTRLRLSSIEATEIDDRLADLMISHPRHLAPHIHAPLQSGSDAVLKRMGRHWYTAARYGSRIEWLAARVGALGLGADVMVGFPGETEDDHKRTVDMVSNLPFTYLHVFPYSERPTAPARHLGAPVDPQLAAARSAELRELATVKKRDYCSQRSGSVADVVLTRRQKGVTQAISGDYLDVVVVNEGQTGRFNAELELTDRGLEARPVELAIA